MPVWKTCIRFNDYVSEIRHYLDWIILVSALCLLELTLVSKSDIEVIMKRIILKLIIVSFYLLALIGCEEDFLDKEPQTSKSLQSFGSVEEMRAYLNQFYSDESGDIIMGKDGGTDNQGIDPAGLVNDNYIIPSADGNIILADAVTADCPSGTQLQ